MQKQHRDFYTTLQTTVAELKEIPNHQDAKFPKWNGDRAQILMWLYNVDHVRKTHNSPGATAISKAIGALDVGTDEHLTGKTFDTLKDFTDFLKTRFLPSDVDRKLLTELHNLRMVGNDFNTYYTKFQAYRRHLKSIDQAVLLCAFYEGLEPHLQQMVQTKKLTTVDQVFDYA